MILPHKGIEPKIDDSCFISPSADIIGDVEIGKDSSVWFQVVIRGDVNKIRIGERTNIQDGAVLHVTRDKPPMKGAPLTLGDDITLGHRVTLHGCTLKNRILVGMGATILDGAVINDDSIVAAGALITKDKVFPPKSLIQGSPAKVVRELTADEIAFLKISATNYVGDSQLYNKEYEELFGDDCGHDHGEGESCGTEKNKDDCCGGGCHE
jgi:carbonic anhydrase/acetyltransferase-like protein (isoleucine patch superfamily)